MGLFDWFTAKRRLREQVARLERQHALAMEEAEMYRERGVATAKMLCSTLAALNVRMQAGEEWSKAFNFHMDKLPTHEQSLVRESMLRMLHQWYNDGIEVNMNQRPEFEFPQE